LSEHLVSAVRKTGLKTPIRRATADEGEDTRTMSSTTTVIVVALVAYYWGRSNGIRHAEAVLPDPEREVEELEERILELEREVSDQEDELLRLADERTGGGGGHWGG
jgi:hypothetical protein